jgi:hypothetical protein
LVGRDEFLQLHKEALIADVCMQWKERLHFVQLILPDMGLAQR